MNPRVLESPVTRKSWAELQQLAPQAATAILALEAAGARGPLDQALLELVKLRVSQINGCALCVDIHLAAARRAGVSEDRMHRLPAWHEARVFTRSERIALFWAEALSRTADATGVDDGAYQAALAEFGDEGLAQLTVGVATVNLWNRLALGYRFALTD